jgi:hypothetical protein
MTENEPGISSAQAARLLGLSKSTMAVWRNRNCGPPVHFALTKPIYFATEVRAWMDECTAAMRQKHEERAAAKRSGGRRRGRPKGSVGLLGGRSEAASS